MHLVLGPCKDKMYLLDDKANKKPNRGILFERQGNVVTFLINVQIQFFNTNYTEMGLTTAQRGQKSKSRTIKSSNRRG
jgi:hypothetical protein